MSAVTARARPAAADHEEGRQLVEGLFNAGRAFRIRLRPTLEREGLSAPMFWTLHQIVSEGPISVGQLADACAVTSANVSSTVDDLESAGLVQRHSSPSDRRVVVLTPTPKGRGAHRTVWDRVGVLVAEALAGLPVSDRSATARVLRRLASPAPLPVATVRGGEA